MDTRGRRRFLASVLVLALALAACAGPDDEADDSALVEDAGGEEVAEDQEDEAEDTEAEEETDDGEDGEEAEGGDGSDEGDDATEMGDTPEERGTYLVSEFFEEFPEHEERHEALLEVLHEEGTAVSVDVDEPIQIAFFLPSMEISDAWARLEGGLTGRLDELEIPYEITEYLTTPDQHNEQASQVEQVLANPDAFDYAIFAPTEWEAQKSHVQRLAAEIPTFAYNVAYPFHDLWGTDESPISHVSFDHEVGAQLLCEWAIEETGGEGTVALLRFVRGLVDNLRSDTFGDCVEANSDMEVVIDYETDGDREKAFTGGNTVLTSNPDLSFMHAASTAISLGALAAQQERGVTDDVILNGWGGGSEELAEIIDGNMDVTVFRIQDDWGVAGAEMIKLHLEGREDEIPGIVSPGMIIIDHTWTEEEIEEQTEFAFRYSGDLDR